MSNKEKNFFRYIGKYLNNDGKIDKLSIRDLVIQFYNRNFKDYFGFINEAGNCLVNIRNIFSKLHSLNDQAAIVSNFL